MHEPQQRQKQQKEQRQGQQISLLSDDKTFRNRYYI